MVDVARHSAPKLRSIAGGCQRRDLRRRDLRREDTDLGHWEKTRMAAPGFRLYDGGHADHKPGLPRKLPAPRWKRASNVELDAGSHLNHLQSTFRCTGPQQIEVAAGLALRPPARRPLLARGRIVSVWDSQQLASAGHILARLFLPGRKRRGSASERATSCRSCR